MQDPFTEDQEEDQIDLAKNILDEDDEEPNFDPEPEQDDDEDEDEEPETIVETKIKRKRKKKKEPRVAKEPGEIDEINEIIEALAPGSTTGVHVKLSRVEPKIFKGKKIEGYITRIDEEFDIDYIKSRFGGGTYDLLFYGPKEYKKGIPTGTKIIKRKRIRIAGNPLLDEENFDAPKKSGQDLDLVNSVLGEQSKMIDKERASNQDMSRLNQDLIKTLVSGNKDDGMKEMLALVTGQFNTTIEAQKEERRQEREEAARREERLAREIAEVKKESTSQLGPIIQMMQMQADKDSKRSETMMTTLVAIMTAMNDKSSNAMREIMGIMTASSKMQIDLLMSELRRTSDEMKELRVNSRSDLTSELQKLKSIKELSAAINGESKEDSGGIGSKIVEALPGVVEALPSLMTLFTPGAQVAAPQQRQAIPAQASVPRPSAGIQSQVQPQQQEEAEIEPEIEDELPEPQNEQEQIGMAIAKLKIQAESAIENGVEPEAFIEDKVIKEFDADLLKQVASVPVQVVIQAIETSFPGDDESPLFTVKGKDFLRKMHAALKSKLASS